MPERRCQTKAVDYRKKCQCRINFFLAFQISGIYIWFSQHHIVRITPAAAVCGHAECITFHYLQFGNAVGIPVTSTNTSSMVVKGVSLSTASNMDVKGVSIFKASSMDVQGVFLSTTNSMDIQGVSLSTTSSMTSSMCPFRRQQNGHPGCISFRNQQYGHAGCAPFHNQQCEHTGCIPVQLLQYRRAGCIPLCKVLSKCRNARLIDILSVLYRNEQIGW